MALRYTWPSLVLITLALALGLVLTASTPAQADDPDTAACERRDELALLIVKNYYVPDEVLQYAKRHCRTGTTVDDNVEYSHYMREPILSSKQPCREVKKSPRQLHEAECIVNWLVFWNACEDVSEARRQEMNSIIERDGLSTDLSQLGNDCRQDDDFSLLDWIVLVIGLLIVLVWIILVVTADLPPAVAYRIVPFLILVVFAQVGVHLIIALLDVIP